MNLTQVIIILVMLAANAVFSGYEIALALAKPMRLKTLVETGRRGARAALWMRQRMESSLAVCQVGITLATAVAAAIGGVSAVDSFRPWLERTYGLTAGWAELISVTLLVLPISAITIIVGELIPKVFALNHPEFVTLILSPAMRIFTWVIYPAVWVCEKITIGVLNPLEKNFGRRDHGRQETALSELQAQVSLLRASRVIGVQEEKIMMGASKLSSLKVRDIMLPAENIVLLYADASLAESIIAAHLDAHTRFPVTEKRGDPQHIVGYINFKELVFLGKTHPENPNLREITRPLSRLSPDLTVSEALRQMVAEHMHLALVRDAGGTVVGMITQEDIFEELVGDIEDEFDRLPKQLTPSGRQWVMGGGTSLGRLRQVLERSNLGAQLSADKTVNDWLSASRKEYLKGGDVVKIDGYSVLIRKVRRHKVFEALLEPDPSKSITDLSSPALRSVEPKEKKRGGKGDEP